MSDRQLLELAAKAAGLAIVWYGEFDPWCYAEIAPGIKWNPITDDGDALRLAVKLRLHVSVFANAIGIGNPVVGYVETPWSEDPYVATRRAIVEAAAEIGRSNT